MYCLFICLFGCVFVFSCLFLLFLNYEDIGIHIQQGFHQSKLIGMYMFQICSCLTIFAYITIYYT